MGNQTVLTYDAIVIGSGQGGKPLAVDLAKAGWQTALIEREHLGGSCVNVGCTPTKTMIASARVAYLARRGKEYGVDMPPVTVDMARVRERKRKIVDSFRSGTERLVKRTDNLNLYEGVGSFTGSHEIEVSLRDGGSVRLKSRNIFINVGVRASVPPIDGLATVPYLDSTSIMELDEIPEHLIVIGGGYIGLEFGQMFCRFGTKVTLLERAQRLLTREDEDVSTEILNILTEDGVAVMLESEVSRVRQLDNGRIEVAVDSSGTKQSLTGTHLLVASGRISNSDSLNLSAAGIETTASGYISTNERLETKVNGVYAIGDVKGGPAFTHISYDDYRVLKRNLLDGDNATISNRLVPYTLFTDPQLGRVGMSETEAKASGRNINVAKLPMTHVARALEMDETRGFMKAVVDVESKQILGCAVLGVEGGEIMNMMQIAMMGNLPYTALRDTAFAHPTLGESLNNLFMTLSE